MKASCSLIVSGGFGSTSTATVPFVSSATACWVITARSPGVKSVGSGASDGGGNSDCDSTGTCWSSALASAIGWDLAVKPAVYWPS